MVVNIDEKQELEINESMSSLITLDSSPQCTHTGRVLVPN